MQTLTRYDGDRAVFCRKSEKQFTRCRVKTLEYDPKRNKLTLYYYAAGDSWNRQGTLKRLELTRAIQLVVLAPLRVLRRVDPRGRLQKFLRQNQLLAAYLDETIFSLYDGEARAVRVVDPKREFVEVHVRDEVASTFMLRFSAGSFYTVNRSFSQQETQMISSWGGSSWVHKKPPGFRL